MREGGWVMGRAWRKGAFGGGGGGRDREREEKKYYRRSIGMKRREENNFPKRKMAKDEI